MLNTIRLCAPATRSERREVADTYIIHYQGNSRLREILYNLSMKILRWTKALTPYVETTIEPFYRESIIELDPNKIIDALYENAVAINAIHNRKVEMIIVGRDVFGTILNGYQMRFNRPFDFTVEQYHSTWALDRKPLSLYGMRIKYVPWFEGVLLVPLD